MENIKTLSTRDLLYAVYRHKNCDGDCNSCPCHNDKHRCSQVYEQVKKELAERNE